VNLFIHSPIRLRGVVLNYLSTGKDFTFTFYHIKENRISHSYRPKNLEVKTKLQDPPIEKTLKTSSLTQILWTRPSRIYALT
jgi:hypothetical protein